MELKKVREHWNNFPEMSLEERPVLSTDLEKLIVKNPLSGGFYLKNNFAIKAILGIILLIYHLCQLKSPLASEGEDYVQTICLCCTLAYFVYFHIRLLVFADYGSLLSLPLLSFLSKIEVVLEKYIISFRILSVLAGFYLLKALEFLLYESHCNAYIAISQSAVYQWLIIVFLAVSVYILLKHSIIPKKRKLVAVVKAYREMIGANSEKL